MKAIYILTTLFLCMISFGYGGICGFDQGYHYSFAGSANEATVAMQIKKYLINKKYTAALGLVELSIDRHIMTYSGAKFKDDYFVGFSPLVYVLEKQEFDKSMQNVCGFRLKNPPELKENNSLVEDLCYQSINNM